MRANLAHDDRVGELRDEPARPAAVWPGAFPDELENKPLATPQWLEVQDVEGMSGPLVLRLVRHTPR